MTLEEEYLILKVNYENKLDMLRVLQDYNQKLKQENEDLLNKVRELKRENEVIADRVHNDALKDLNEINKSYWSQIDRLEQQNSFFIKQMASRYELRIEPLRVDCTDLGNTVYNGDFEKFKQALKATKDIR